jgi:hypothetical protein
MIKHIILLKLKDRSPESIERTALVLRDMEGKIKELLSIEVGIDILRSERSFDIALTETFASREAMQAYLAHPVHRSVIEHIAVVCDTKIIVSYEI